MSRGVIHLDQLLKGLKHGALESNPRVKDISSDSRCIGVGDLFVALRGERVDARQYIGEVLDKGAVAVLVDSADQPPLEPALRRSNSVIEVENLRQSLSLIAARFYAHPSHQLKVVGITGTNGKTTIAWCLAQVLSELGSPAGMIGTLGAGKVDALDDTGLTTPDAIEVQKQLAELVEQGIEVVCVEVSSHALELWRVTEVEFDTVVFSNLSQDHLDFHQNMERYAAAKQRLFEEFDYRLAVINTDDSLGRKMATDLDVEMLTYGIESGQLQAVDVQLVSDGLEFVLAEKAHRVAVKTPLIGAFNVYNLAAVSGVAVGMGYSLCDVARAIEKCRAVPGRMERIEAGSAWPAVVVDYAHTPDALEKALAACRGHCAGSLAVVFGCGGDRDRAKRPKMGRIAEQGADRVFITDDNPRGENASSIVADIAQGISGQAWVLHDRKSAIRAAVASSGDKDWVLIAGKGHETRQIYANHVVELDDRVIAREVLQKVAA